MDKVKLDVLRPWISKKITEYLHIEDDVVVEFVYNQLEDKVNSSFFNSTANFKTKKNRTFLKKIQICSLFKPRPQNECTHAVSMPKKDANQYDRIFKWKKCQTIYGRTVGTAVVRSGI